MVIICRAICWENPPGNEKGLFCLFIPFYFNLYYLWPVTAYLFFSSSYIEYQYNIQSHVRWRRRKKKHYFSHHSVIYNLISSNKLNWMLYMIFFFFSFVERTISDYIYFLYVIFMHCSQSIKSFIVLLNLCANNGLFFRKSSIQ